MNKKRIVIMGGGLGGMTVAHELIKFKKNYISKNGVSDIEIIIIERNNILGGLARSSYNSTGLPSEYCWRIYGPFYNNLRSILKEIPIRDDYKSTLKKDVDLSKKRTLHDNLVDVKDYIIARDGQDGRPNKIYTLNNNVFSATRNESPYQTIPAEDKATFLEAYLLGATSCDERMDSYDDISWQDFLKKNNKSVSYDLYTFAVKATAPFLGVDYGKVNAPVVLKTLENFQYFSSVPLSVMNGPTNEAFIDQWEKYLLDNGVLIRKNTNITKINTENLTINNIILDNGEVINADYFVCSLSVESMAILIERNDMKNKKILGKIPELSQISRQRMLSVQYYLNSLFSFNGEKTVIYLPDSPWQIVIEPQGHLWDVDLSKYGNNSVKDIWSVALDDVLTPGLYHKKTWVECTEQEIREELWYQILNTKSLENLRSDDGLSLKDIAVVDFYMWESFRYNDGIMDTWEPKFSNNVGTLKLRPYSYTDYKNLFYSTAYCRTSSDMYEMETSAEAGKNASQALINDMIGFGNYDVDISIDERPIKVLSPLRAMDVMMFNLGLPHLSKFTGDSSVVLVFLYVILIIFLIAYVWIYLCKKNKKSHKK